MTLTKIVAIALAVLTVTAGAAAAMPGNAPEHARTNDNAEQTDEHSQAGDPASGNESEDAVHGDGMAEQQRTTNQERQGPPVDLPSPVPDHVRQIHDLIRQVLNDELDGSLGKAISDMMGGGQADHGGNGNAAQRG